MVENATRVKSGTMVYTDMIAKIRKNIMHVKKIKFGVLLLAFVKMYY